ncbi:MAG: glycosyltransferase family 2 protein [Bacteroidaceae bacterium]|nr:glycosyltransferase family 2 protein [Bacteroidaceae bacterium]
MKKFTVGIVISTYNNPRWLEKTLWSYEVQSVVPDEVIIADDGSGEETRMLIDSFKASLPIKHVWHKDEGFRKTRILNEALRVATSDYLIFTDQDCVARPDFIETHLRFARERYILSGGYFKLPMDISECITREDIMCGRAFTLDWLVGKGLKRNFKCTKLFNSRWFSAFMNFITPAKATWNGMNSSGWRRDILAVNGFDERMQYGGEDREMGERMFNNGIRSKQIRYSAIILHLDHKRPYVNAEALERNKAIRKETKRLNRVTTEFGLGMREDCE